VPVSLVNQELGKPIEAAEYKHEFMLRGWRCIEPDDIFCSHVIHGINELGNIPEDIIVFANRLLDMGGILSGGAARYIMYQHLEIDEGLKDSYSDIDFFAPDRETLQDMIDRMSDWPSTVSPSPWGIHYHTVFKGPPINLITAMVGNPPDLLRTFDIDRCMYAVTHDKVFQTTQYPQARICGTSNPARTLKRVMKLTGHGIVPSMLDLASLGCLVGILYDMSSKEGKDIMMGDYDGGTS